MSSARHVNERYQIRQVEERETHNNKTSHHCRTIAETRKFQECPVTSLSSSRCLSVSLSLSLSIRKARNPPFFHVPPPIISLGLNQPTKNQNLTLYNHAGRNEELVGQVLHDDDDAMDWIYWIL